MVDYETGMQRRMKKYLSGLTKALIVSVIFLPLGLILNLLIKRRKTFYEVNDNRES